MTKKKSITHQQMDAMNWRYKKRMPPTDEFASKNGPVKIIKPAINGSIAKKKVKKQRIPIVYRREFADNMNHLRNIMKED